MKCLLVFFFEESILRKFLICARKKKNIIILRIDYMYMNTIMWSSDHLENAQRRTVRVWNMESRF